MFQLAAVYECFKSAFSFMRYIILAVFSYLKSVGEIL